MKDETIVFDGNIPENRDPIEIAKRVSRERGGAGIRSNRGWTGDKVPIGPSATVIMPNGDQIHVVSRRV